MGAMFLGTFVYAAFVAYLEYEAAFGADGVDSSLVLLVRLVGAAAVIAFIAGLFMERRILSEETIHAPRKAVVIQGALAEATAGYGVLAYLLSGYTEWFVPFLAMSWLQFLILAVRTPGILRGMGDCLRTD